MNPNEVEKKTFKFIHDLNVFFSEVYEILSIKDLEDAVSFVNSLYPKLRYPTGDLVSFEEAEKCLTIARRIVQHKNI